MSSQLTESREIQGLMFFRHFDDRKKGGIPNLNLSLMPHGRQIKEERKKKELEMYLSTVKASNWGRGLHLRHAP
jgi:hypothetical protein